MAKVMHFPLYTKSALQGEGEREIPFSNAPGTIAGNPDLICKRHNYKSTHYLEMYWRNSVLRPKVFISAGTAPHVKNHVPILSMRWGKREGNLVDHVWGNKGSGNGGDSYGLVPTCGSSIIREPATYNSYTVLLTTDQRNLQNTCNWQSWWTQLILVKICCYSCFRKSCWVSCGFFLRWLLTSNILYWGTDLIGKSVIGVSIWIASNA